jgi:hypothetical protein
LKITGKWDSINNNKPQINTDEHGFAAWYLCLSVFICGSKYMDKSKHGN